MREQLKRNKQNKRENERDRKLMAKAETEKSLKLIPWSTPGLEYFMEITRERFVQHEQVLIKNVVVASLKKFVNQPANDAHSMRKVKPRTR